MRQSNIEVKKANRNKVFRFINSKEKTIMPEIASSLNMSMPTVLTIVNELKDRGYVKENGEFHSTGGRKPKAISSVQDSGYAIGLDITKNHIGIILTNLSKKNLSYKRIRYPYRNEEGYYRKMSIIVEEYIKKAAITKGKLLGIGIAVPGIVNEEEGRITFSHALGIEDVPTETFTGKLPLPAMVINDASAGAMAECINKQAEENMIYLSLSNTVGGAIVLGHQIYTNDYRNFYKGDYFKSGEFGHIVIRPGGKQCYCGKYGCLDPYCSAYNLAKQEGGDLDSFFDELEAENKKYEKIWETYLDELALGIDILRMSFDCDIVLGGYVGSKIEPYLDGLKERLKRVDIFEDDGKYLRSSRYKTEATALGAATFVIDNYIDQI